MAKGVNKESLFGDLTLPDDVCEHNHDGVYTHTHEDAVATKKAIKTKRIQILTYSNLVRRMDLYAKKRGLSRAEVFEMAVSKFLDEI